MIKYLLLQYNTYSSFVYIFIINYCITDQVDLVRKYIKLFLFLFSFIYSLMFDSEQIRNNEYCYGQESLYGSKTRRPGASYAELITMAIESSPCNQLSLKDIYSWISNTFPYFELSKTGWQNSVRHNLSLNKCFYKVPRTEENPGKGSYWRINYEFQNVKMNYRTKRYNYKQENPTIASLNDILNDRNLISEKIGVNEIPYKTLFDGRLDEEERINEEKKTKMPSLFSFQ